MTHATSSNDTTINTESHTATRRMFIGTAGLASTGLAALGLALPSAALSMTTPASGNPGDDDTMKAPGYDTFPAQNPELVRDMVGASHGRLERVRELLEINPALAKATWDWGFGDWESALGAAAHTGSREIAMLLMDNGARPTLFSAAMLGQLDVVRAFIQAQPGAQHIPGPHGIPLLVHAQLGGEDAKPVVAYLESLADDNSAQPDPPTLTDEQKQAYVGKYAFGASEEQRLEILLNSRGGVSIKLPGSFARGMRYIGEDTFIPAGAVGARVKFERRSADTQPHVVMVLDPDPMLVALRQ